MLSPHHVCEVGFDTIYLYLSGVRWEVVPMALCRSRNSIMLIGEYTHILDSKKRLSLPSKFRKELGKKLVVTHGLDNCLFVYSASEWSRIAEQISKLGLGQADSRGFNRFMLAGAQEVSVDSAGRILVPDFLKSFAKLGTKVVLAGVYNRLEIWNEKTWALYKKSIQGKADQLAEKLSDINAL